MARSVLPRLDLVRTRDSLVAFLEETLQRTGLRRFVLGLSGGVDSALSCALGCEAAGPGGIVPVKMPYRTSDPNSEAHADLAASSLGLRAERVDITSMVDSYLGDNGSVSTLRRGNLAARARMAVLFDIAARERGLVLGTSNRTEILLGYGTWYGDTACSLNPLGNLFKTHVWALAESQGVPAMILEKAPSADLWPDQTDESELGFSYALADEALYRMVEMGQTPEEIASEELPLDRVLDVRRRMEANAFKRRPPALGPVVYEKD